MKNYILIQLFVLLHIVCVALMIPTFGQIYRIITYIEKKSALIRQYEKDMSEMSGW